jgi:GTP-binding protein HflX
MSESRREELPLGQEAERVLVVGVILPNSTADPRDPLGELRSLAGTAGAEVVDQILAKRPKPHPGLYVGAGKARQIADRCEQNEIDCVIFDNDLAPGQIRELEKLTDCKVLDRSELILDIFAAHASTAQSRLQVELAQLEYTYPRLTGMWSHLDRHGGGVGTRGPGERQIETDRRIVQKRVSYLKEKLAAIDRRRLREVQGRDESFCVCLVGYTNAGKSTLMNLLTGTRTYVADKLFATLETKTRKWNLSQGRDVLLSDTVGFVRDLPHHLVASFRATLEEAIHADLLIHVADASHQRVDDEITAVRKVLAELGCPREKELLVLNKIDKILDPTLYATLNKNHPNSLFISAATGKGAEKLLATVASRASGSVVRVRLQANFRNGKLMSYIARHAEIEQQSYDDAVVDIRANMPAEKLDILRRFGTDVSIFRE